MISTKNILVALISVATLSFTSTAGSTEPPSATTLHGSSATFFEWHQREGANSQVDEGGVWRQELSLTLQKQLTDKRVGLSLRGRATNDDQVEEDLASLLYLQGYLRSENWDIEIGDVAAAYSPLVLSSSAKGAKLNFRSGSYDQGWDLSLIGGIQKNYWDEIYDSSEDESTDRYLIGAETAWKYAPAQSLGVSVSLVKDDPATVITTNAFENVPAQAETAGIDWNWRFDRYITLKGEAAYNHSDTENDGLGDTEDTAVRVKLYTKPLPRSLRSNFFYERLGSDYTPQVASVSADRQRIENDTEWMPNRQIKTRLSLKHSRDNLDGSLGATQTIRDVVLSVSYRPDWLKRGDFDLRLQGKKTNGRGTDEIMRLISADFNNRPKGGWRYGLGWVFTDINDDTASNTDQQLNTFRATLGWKKSLAEEHSLRTTLTLNTNISNRNNADQLSFGGRLDAGYEAGDLWSVDLFASLKEADNEESSDNQYLTCQLRGDYHPGGDRSKSIRLSAERSEYSTEESDDQDYLEHLVKIAYLFSF